jgi:hypothetical protein
MGKSDVAIIREEVLTNIHNEDFEIVNDGQYFYACGVLLNELSFMSKSISNILLLINTVKTVKVLKNKLLDLSKRNMDIVEEWKQPHKELLAHTLCYVPKIEEIDKEARKFLDSGLMDHGTKNY